MKQPRDFSLFGSRDSQGSVSFVKPRVNERHEEMRKEIVKRLRHVCSEFPPEEFEELVEKMLKVRLRDDQPS